MNRLKKLQKERKLTQQELADIADVSKRTIQNWENGESNIKPEKAKLLANYFNIPISYLLGYDDNDFEKQIKIDTLNDIVDKLQKTHISLREEVSMDFWKGFTAALLIVQTQKMVLDFEKLTDSKGEKK